MSPLSVAVASPHQFTRCGIEGLLRTQTDRVEVVALAAGLHPARASGFSPGTVDPLVLSHGAASDGSSSPDVIVYDAIELHDRDSDDPLVDLLASTEAPVVAIGPHFRHDLLARACDAGAVVGLDFTIESPELVEILTAVARGASPRRLMSMTGVVDASASVAATGLTPRELEVISLIAGGFSNVQIAHELYLSINSVKTYIRHAYRRIGVGSRSQAVRWAMENGHAAAKAVPTMVEPPAS